MTTIAHKLQAYGSRVDKMENARVGDTFSLNAPNLKLRVDVEEYPVDSGNRSFFFTEGYESLEGERPSGSMCVGNIHGAYQTYATLIAPLFREYSDEIIARIERFDIQCGEAQHTDIGEVWELLNWIRDTLRADKGELL